MSAAEEYTLPDGWLSCDACGRPVHYSNLDKHMGSTACEHAQYEHRPPPGWVSINLLGTGEYTVQFLASLKVPLFKRYHDDGQMLAAYVPTWVHIIAAVACDRTTIAEAVKRARLDAQYRAAVLAGLRLVGKADCDAIISILQLNPKDKQ